jgi:hypothetical protein
MEIESFLNETDNMKIEGNIIYYKDNSVARLYDIIHYKIQLNNYIKKMVEKINNNEKKLKNIEKYFMTLGIIFIINEVLSVFF